jgi:hypothetical protein
MTMVRWRGTGATGAQGWKPRPFAARLAVLNLRSSETVPRKKRPSRASAFLGVRRTQAELDFVDVDVYGDVPLFINPGALRRNDSTWAHECVFLLQDFMSVVVDAIVANDLDKARGLLSYLSEPNETHLGLSAAGAAARGHGVKVEFSELLINAIQGSPAGHSGRIIDLEDTVMMIPGVGSDLVSDITTNIIRGPLIQYTNDICAAYGVDTSTFLARRDQPVWDSLAHEWTQPEVTLPIANGRALILVPKGIVRAKVDADSYFSDYLMPFIVEREMDNPNSQFVKLLKDERRVPLRGEIRKEFSGKENASNLLVSDEKLYVKYRDAVSKGDPRKPHESSILAAVDSTVPDLDALLADITALPTGNEAFGAYELAVDRLWGALFSGVLQFPKRQLEQNLGRKRVDMVWTNTTSSGFFGWLKDVCTAHYVMAEYKNYGREIGNPEFDQLAGRFGRSKGEFGFLICRNIEDKARAFARARDLRADGRGYILPLDDDDLRQLVEAAKLGSDEIFAFFQERFAKVAH